MFTLDNFDRRETKERASSARRRRTDAELIASGKIIDFESARRAFERDQSAESHGKQFSRTLLSDIGTARSGGFAESLIAIGLALIIGLSLLIGVIWGF
jgi:hypothetical protein